MRRKFRREYPADGRNSQTTPKPLEEWQFGGPCPLPERGLEKAQGVVKEARGGTEGGGGALAAQGGDVATGTDELDVPFSLASRAMFL